MKHTAWILAFAFLVLGLAVPQTGVAQDAGTNEHARSGFWFNGGLGWGSFGCDDCTEREGGLILSLGAGGTISQKVTLGGSIDGWTKEEQGTRLTASTLLGTLRFYPSATGGFFLRGGLGLGALEAEVSGLGSDNETGAAALLGLGYDFRIGDNVSLTPFLNGVGIALEDNNVNFNQLGLSITTH